ncbi:hypothetical protein H8E88_10800 [candidate division KSB1 bacterium]|nr:hypothetical protein [candidate division KSB1 bacterium]
MGLIRESIEVDFFFDPKPVSKEDVQKISDYIKSDKKLKFRKTKQKHIIRTMEQKVSPSNLS